MTLRHISILAGFGLFLFLPGCSRSDLHSRPLAETGSTSYQSIPGQQRLTAEGQASLGNFLNSAELPDLHWSNFANYQKEAVRFYDASSGTLPWIQNGKPTNQARAIVQSLKIADERGLRPEDYDGPQWDARLSKFDAQASMQEPELVKFDLALTVSTMRYISDLHLGRVNPRLFHFGLDIDRQDIDFSDFLVQRLVGA